MRIAKQALSGVCAFVALQGAVALADGGEGLTGDWSGRGSAVMPGGRKRSCSEIALRIERDESRFTLHEGFYRCEDLKASFDPFRFEIHDGELFHRGTKVGRADESSIEVEYEDAEEGFAYRWRLAREGEALTYLEEWREGGELKLVVSGSLTR